MYGLYAVLVAALVSCNVDASGLVSIPIEVSAVYDSSSSWYDLTVVISYTGRNPGMSEVKANITAHNVSSPSLFVHQSAPYLSRSLVNGVDTIYTDFVRKPVYIRQIDTTERFGNTDTSLPLLSLLGWKENIQICNRRFQIWTAGYSRGYDRCPLSHSNPKRASFSCPSYSPFWPNCKTIGVVNNRYIADVAFDMRGRNIRVSSDVFLLYNTTGILRIGEMTLTIDPNEVFSLSDANGILQWVINTLIEDTGLPEKTIVIGMFINSPLSIIWDRDGGVVVEHTWAEDNPDEYYSTVVLICSVFGYFGVVLFPRTRIIALAAMGCFLILEIYYLWIEALPLTLHRATRIYTYTTCVVISIIGVSASAFAFVAQVIEINNSEWADKALMHTAAFPFFAMSTLVFEMIPAAYLVSFLSSLIMAAFISNMALIYVSKWSSMLSLTLSSLMVGFIVLYLIVPVCERVAAFRQNEILSSASVLFFVFLFVVLRKLRIVSI